MLRVRKTFAARKAFVLFVAGQSYRYARQCLRNLVKIGLGRKPSFSGRDEFFRLYIKQMILRQPIRYITCVCSPGEGAGSQAHMIMRAIYFAEVCGLTYLHAPFRAIAHGNRPMTDWVEAWERHFNLGWGEHPMGNETRDAVNFAANFDTLTRCFGVEGQENLPAGIIPKFRQKYYSNKTPRSDAVLTVGVHVRQGDVLLKNPQMWTRMSDVATTIADVKSAVESAAVDYVIRIFSDGKPEDFAELERAGAELFLNADPIWTMSELIEADILVMAKSAFSYVAGLISDGIKLYEPFYQGFDDWIVCDAKGHFDRPALERRLTLMSRGSAPYSISKHR